jgi:sRNA-binding carbon storage regulator CsrA
MALILKRAARQEIVITTGCGEEIRIELLETQTSLVRVSIDAPPTVRIDRAEVHERRQKQVKEGR